MEITAKMVKELRDATNCGMMDCKKALAESDGDMDKAVEYLRKKGIASAAKKEGRTTSQGLVGSYIHMGGKVGVLVEVACETDFVARTDDFQEMVRNIAMHVAAANPLAVSRDEVDGTLVEKERDIYRAQMREQGKPDNIIDKIVEGKVDKYYADVVLLEQKYVKDPDMTVEDYLKSVIGKLGENMQIKRFARYQIGA
ncbi:MAG: translation elongation factor Ts [Candidatus Krumholzibacteriia bacterium]